MYYADCPVKGGEISDRVEEQQCTTHASMSPCANWGGGAMTGTVGSSVGREWVVVSVLRSCSWSVRQIDRQISSQFYERTALSRELGCPVVNEILLRVQRGKDRIVLVHPELALSVAPY